MLAKQLALVATEVTESSHQQLIASLINTLYCVNLWKGCIQLFERFVLNQDKLN